MSTSTITRDYSLVGPEADKAVAAGLASAKWYTPPIKRAELKELMRREDGPAIRDTLIWIAAFIVSGGLGYYFWGTWAAVPFFIIYGVLYGSSTDSRWHECGHRTAFKTQWMNDAVYQVACFMIMREPEIWRWSHTRHHTDTVIVGRDPEIITPRPPDVVSLLLEIFAIKSTWVFFQKLFLHARGRLTEEEATFVPAASGRTSISSLASTSPFTPWFSSPVSRSAPSCRRCISACRRSTAGCSRSISARRSISASPRTCSITG